MEGKKEGRKEGKDRMREGKKFLFKSLQLALCLDISLTLTQVIYNSI
jgi:hypothetical protein